VHTHRAGIERERERERENARGSETGREDKKRTEICAYMEREIDDIYLFLCT